MRRLWAALLRFIRRLAHWQTPAPPKRRPRPGEPGYMSGSDYVRIRRWFRRRVHDELASRGFHPVTVSTLMQRRRRAVGRLARVPHRKDLRRQLVQLDVEIDRRMMLGV